ncbi:MAG: tetratricopeptide repeat protein [Gemmatimonadales bacterium]|jgi:tetratricopeptide (TPR) repeat protein
MAPRLKQLVHEIHRRSLWQVTTVYVGASWFVLEVTDQVIERFLLPEWVYGGAIILLLIGLPIVLATAFVREDAPSTHPEPTPVPPDAGGDEPERLPSAAGPGVTIRLLTWPKAIVGGVLAFAALGLIAAFVVLRGTARVTDAYGAAGDAFGEREYIVVARFEASEDEEDIALAAREALTIDLQQSQYVNVLGRDQIGPVLRRMQLPDTARLDRRLAVEVAEREGLAAVLTGQVNRLGNDYQFVARVIEPSSGRELIGVRTAASADRMIEGVEALSREVRGRLGEESSAIRRSRPLPEVTTNSLEALKVYAQAVAATERDDYENAIELAKQAIRFDTTFAMGYRLASVLSNNLGRFEDSQAYATRAYELRDRLTEIERLHVEAFYHASVAWDLRRAADIYERVLSLYPDDERAANNLGVVTNWAGDIERSYHAYTRGVELNPGLGMSYTNAIGAAFGTDRWAEADSLIELAERRGFDEIVMRHRIGRLFEKGDLEGADQLCDSLLAVMDNAGLLANHRQVCGSIDISRGRLERGIERLEAAVRYYADARQSWFLHQGVGALIVAEQMRGNPEEAATRLDELLTRFPADSLGEQDRFFVATGLRVYAGVLGRTDLAERVAAAYPGAAGVAEWMARYGEAMGVAAEALSRDEYETALDELSDGTAGDYKPSFWASMVDLLYGLAYDGAGVTDSAIAYLEAATSPGELAIWWVPASDVYLPFVLWRLADLEESRGNTAAAVEHYQRFLDLWSDADPEVHGQVAAAERALTRLAGGERQ